MLAAQDFPPFAEKRKKSDTKKEKRVWKQVFRSNRNHKRDENGAGSASSRIYVFTSEIFDGHSLAEYEHMLFAFHYKYIR